MCYNKGGEKLKRKLQIFPSALLKFSISTKTTSLKALEERFERDSSNFKEAMTS